MPEVIVERNEPLLPHDTEAASGISGTVMLAKDVQLSLGRNRIMWLRLPSRGGERGFDMADVLGCSALDNPPRLVLHAAPRARGGFCGLKAPARQRNTKELLCSFFEQATSVCSTVRQLLGTDGGSAPRRPWLVLINPFGGGGKAPRVWAELERLLEPLNLLYDITRTTHAGHAYELGAKLSVGAYEGVISVSGDGLVYELVNGMMSRADGAAALVATTIFPVPGGTGNALFRSICHRSNEKDDLLGAAFILAKGRATPLDLWEYVRPDAPLVSLEAGVTSAPASAADASSLSNAASLDAPTAAPKAAPTAAPTAQAPAGNGGAPTSLAPGALVAWSILSFAWGIVADVDIESEVLRGLGALRLTLWAIWRLISFRQYAGTLHYLDAADDTWKEIRSDRFVGLWACNVPYMSQTDFAAPHAEFANGVLDVLVLENTTRLQALDMFLSIEDGASLIAPLNASLLPLNVSEWRLGLPPSSGTHLGKRGLSLLKLKAFRFEPAPRTPASPGILDIDGEVVPFGPIEVRPHPSGLRVLSM